MSRAKVEQPDLTSHCGYTNMGGGNLEAFIPQVNGE